MLFGAKRLLLIGFDMRRVNGLQHFFGSHPGAMNKDSDYPVWVRYFDAIARDLKEMGVEVINCSPASALYQFPKMRLEEVCPEPFCSSEISRSIEGTPLSPASQPAATT